MFKMSSFGAGFAAGFGVGLISRELVTTGTTVFRPMVKGSMKTAAALFQKGKTALANMGESFEDLLAEVRSELSSKEPDIEETIITTIEVEDGSTERAPRSKSERKKEQRS